MSRASLKGALLLFSVVVAAGCSSDGDKAAPDAMAEVADAAATGDGTEGEVDGKKTPFLLRQCGGEMNAVDAGMADSSDGGSAGSDAGAVDSDAGALDSDAGALDLDAGIDSDAGAVETADAGGSEPAGGAALGEPCCGSNEACASGLACIEDADQKMSCRPSCDLEAPECGSAGICATFGDVGACIPAGAEGDACSPELCNVETICVGETADDAVCHRRCQNVDDCDDGMECLPLGGSASNACF